MLDTLFVKTIHPWPFSVNSSETSYDWVLNMTKKNPTKTVTLSFIISVIKMLTKNKS